jgi:hypothetical protein
MDHVDAVEAATEPELDEALARAIRLLIAGAVEAPAAQAS